MNRPVSTPEEREQQEMDYLRELLVLPFWTAGEAVMILMGVSPDPADTTPHNNGNYHYSFLPNGRRKEWLSWDGTFDQSKFDRNFSDEIEHVRTFIYSEHDGRTIKAALDWIALGRKWKYEPPWWQLSLSDEKCRKILSPLMQPSPIDELENKPKKGLQGLGGRQKWNNSKYKVIKDSIFEMYREWLTCH